MTSIREFQDLMRTLYGLRDTARGVQATMIWLVSEIGELANAMVKGSPPEALRDEVVDVLAWLCSLCNVLGIDLERSAVLKYDEKCPRCRSSPCLCAIK